MKLGVFSLSLNVKDINASKSFYENLGFSVFGGDIKMNYLIMKNGKSLIGLFQGMFENNILTFNPGWDENANNEKTFDDIREIQSAFLFSRKLETLQLQKHRVQIPSFMKLMWQIDISKLTAHCFVMMIFLISYKAVQWR